MQLVGAEIVDRSAVSSTIGLLGWIAYLGAAFSGYPLTKLVTKLGWKVYFVSLLGSAVAAMLLLLPMWRVGMGSKTKPVPEFTAPELAPNASAAALALPGGGIAISQCGSCAGVGTVMRLECGPATPAEQSVSCRYVEKSCPYCAGRGYLGPVPISYGS
jgi:hypothetical protein